MIGSVHTDDIQKNRNNTYIELFEFTRMPFGLKNDAQTFRRFINKIFNGLKLCFGYIDDILVAS